MEDAEIQQLLGETIYRRARRYFQLGRVQDLDAQESAPGVLYLTADVGGDERYAVQVWLDKASDTLRSASCTCPCNANGDGPLCKHIGAVLLAHAAGNAAAARAGEAAAAVGKAPLETLLAEKKLTRASEMPTPQQSSYASNLEMLFGSKWRGTAAESDQQATRLLRRFQEQAAHAPLPGPVCPPESIHLEPELVPDALRRTARPELRLRVRGAGRSYVVRDIPAFLAAIDRGDTVRYGEQLSFVHQIEAFDADSRALIGLLRTQAELLDYAGEMVRGGGRLTLRSGSSMPLAPAACDALYDLYRPAGALGDRLLPEQPPRLTLRAEKRRGGAALEITPCPGSFTGSRQTYFFTDKALWPLSHAAAKPLTMALDEIGDRLIFFKTADLTAFCSYVLPEIRAYLDIQDPARVLLDQIPLEPVVQFYLDAPAPGEISAYAAFLYGEDTVSPYAPPDGSFLRDSRTEERAGAALARLLPPDPLQAGVFSTMDADKVENFLDQGVPVLLAMGEVYLTDAFRAMEAPHPRITVGVSLKSNMLDLEVDTGEFPPEELRALLDSLRLKKRYHRLRDGRLLRLDGSLDVLGDLQETLADSGAALAAGHTSLPLYRAPGLDKALAGQNGVGFVRDAAFRRMSRSFHSVADAEYALPDTLQNVLRRYQRTGYRWLRMLDSYGMGGILADDMGLGKTLQVLAFLLAKKQEGETRPSLIVCPASLVLNWAEEAARFTPELRVLVMDGTAAQRAVLADRFDAQDLIVTGYDLLRRDGALYADQEFYACILDEAQAIKNQTTQKYRAVCQIRSQVRFALTGTPIENRLSELWSIFSFLMPGYLYGYRVFRERFEKPIVQEGSEEAARRLNQLTSPFVLRRMKADVLKELPPKVENVRHVTMGREQRRLYLASVLDAKERLKAAGPADRVQAFAALTRLRQICCDPRLAVEGWQGESAKLEACLELVTTAVAGGHQILLFSQFTSMLALIADRLREAEISFFTLQGDTPKPVRADLVHRFNAGEASVFLISLKAGGTGLNLTAADIVIHYDPWWNLAAQNQATDRAYRIGQKNTVQVYKLIVQDSIEEKILALQSAKQDLADTITGSADGSILSMTPAELLQLLEDGAPGL